MKIQSEARGSLNVHVSQDDERIINAISAHIALSLTEWFGSGAEIIQLVPTIQTRRLSWFLSYRVRLPDSTMQTLLVKLPRRPYAPAIAQAIVIERLRSLMAAEYTSLSAVASLIAEHDETQTLTAIRPVAFLDEWAAHVTLDLPAISLAHLLFQPQMALNRPGDRWWIAEALRRGCLWLRLYHEQLGAQQPEPLNPQSVVAEVDRLGHEIEQASSEIQLDWARAACAELAHSAAGQPTMVASSHADFHLGNLLVAPDGRVGVIDIDGSQRQPIYADLACLFVDILVRQRQVLSYGLFHRSHNLAMVGQTVLESYFEERPCSLPILRLFCVLPVLRQWRHAEHVFQQTQSRKRIAARVLTPYVRRYFAHILRQCLDPHHQAARLGAPFASMQSLLQMEGL